MKLRVQSSEFRVKSFFKKLFTVYCSLFSFFLLFIIHCLLFTDTVTASYKWSGVDETVVEKFAKEYGREAREPFINTDQGDLLLFVFLLAGAVGGFIAGYYWRILTEVRGQKPKVRIQTTENR